MKQASKYCHAVVVTTFRSEDYVSGFRAFLVCLTDTDKDLLKIQLFSDCLVTFLGFGNIEFWLSYSFSGTMLLVSGTYLVLC